MYTYSWNIFENISNPVEDIIINKKYFDDRIRKVVKSGQRATWKKDKLKDPKIWVLPISPWSLNLLQQQSYYPLLYGKPTDGE